MQKPRKLISCLMHLQLKALLDTEKRLPSVEVCHRAVRGRAVEATGPPGHTHGGRRWREGESDSHRMPVPETSAPQTPDSI